MAWRIEPRDKKCIVDVTKFVKVLKNGKKLYVEEQVGYRWGHADVEEDPTESYQKLQAEGKPLCVNDFGIIDWSYSDGCWSDKVGVYDLSEAQQKLIEEAWTLEEAGWESYDGETLFYGELDIINLDEEISEEE